MVNCLYLCILVCFTSSCKNGHFHVIISCPFQNCDLTSVHMVKYVFMLSFKITVSQLQCHLYDKICNNNFNNLHEFLLPTPPAKFKVMYVWKSVLLIHHPSPWTKWIENTFIQILYFLYRSISCYQCIYHYIFCNAV